MGNIKHGYKVVIKYPNQHPASIVISNIIGKVYYILNRWVSPNNSCGPLAVFQTLDQAIYFARMHVNKNIKIYTCEYVEGNQVEGLYIPGTLRDLVRYIDQCPSGTVFATKVKLTKMIYRTEKSWGSSYRLRKA